MDDWSLRIITGCGLENILHQICIALDLCGLLAMGCVDHYHHHFVSQFEDPLYWKLMLIQITSDNEDLKGSLPLLSWRDLFFYQRRMKKLKRQLRKASKKETSWNYLEACKIINIVPVGITSSVPVKELLTLKEQQLLSIWKILFPSDSEYQLFDMNDQNTFLDAVQFLITTAAKCITCFKKHQSELIPNGPLHSFGLSSKMHDYFIECGKLPYLYRSERKKRKETEKKEEEEEEEKKVPTWWTSLTKDQIEDKLIKLEQYIVLILPIIGRENQLKRLVEIEMTLREKILVKITQMIKEEEECGSTPEDVLIHFNSKAPESIWDFWLNYIHNEK